MTLDTFIEGALKRDRLVVGLALAAVIVLSWAYVLAGAGTGMSTWEMSRLTVGGSRDLAPGMSVPHGDRAPMAGMDMTTPAAWTAGYAGLMFFMWWIMMIAMMLPSAAPMILLFVAVNRKQRERGNPYVPTLVFALAYLGVWALFSALATAMQWGLHRIEWISGMMAIQSTTLCAVVLVAAGLYQFTPLKRSCLRHCQSPLQFLSTRWRPGTAGAVRMGMEHGTYCVGCCWSLMLLLFVGGVMNLYWIGGLALYVLLEKLTPPGHWSGQFAGAALVAAGLVLLV